VRVAKLRTKNGALRLVFWEVGLALLVLGVLGEVETVLSLGWYRTSAKFETFTNSGEALLVERSRRHGRQCVPRHMVE
jgi:hypothetical protein